MAPTIPKDCRDIVHGRDSFVFPGWQKAWFNAQVFRISGLTDALAPIGVRRDHIQFINLAAEKVMGRVPEQWVKFFDPKDGAYGAWTQIGKPQIERHLHKGFPQVFDRALMSIVYTIVYVEDFLKKEIPQNFFDEVRVVPIPYAVEVGAKDIWTDVENKANLRQALIDSVYPCPPDLVGDALKDGLRITFRNAKNLQEALVAESYSARIVCTPSSKPAASNREVLAVSRLIEHPAVSGFMHIAG